MHDVPAAPHKAVRRDLLILGHPELWPRWPFLPVVRRPPGAAAEYGVVVDLYHLAGLTGFGAAVFRTNLFTLPPTLAGLVAMPRETFDTVEELAAAGWVVD